MSKLDITFQVQQNPGTNKGTVTVRYTQDGLTMLLDLDLVTQRTGKGEFTEVTYVDGVSDSEAQAVNYARAFSADYRVVGDSISDNSDGGFETVKNEVETNLLAVAEGNVVTISSTGGTFGNTTYSGDVLLINETIENVAEPDPEVFTVSKTGNGDCNNVELEFAASGGTPPYNLYRGTNLILSNWDGTTHIQNSPRKGYINYSVVDSQSNQIGNEQSIYHPRKLATGDFSIIIRNYIDYADVGIKWQNRIADVEPIEYSLDNINYQTQNAFSGLLPDSYTLYIRDTYGCVITKTFEVLLIETQDEQTEPYFEVSNLNAIKYVEYTNYTNQVKKNYHNALSHREIGRIAYSITQEWDEEDLVWTQFKSSFPYHNITLLEQDGTKTSIPLIQIQENIGFTEKVDCWIYPKDGKTGVYFDGGNKYSPGTDTVIGASEYTDLPPTWAKVGQLVELEGVGRLPIDDSVKFDEEINKFYFTVGLVTSSLEASKIETIYNKQPYNAFEFVMQVANIADEARVIIEAGNNVDEIAVCYVSEVQRRILDNEEYLLIQWNDDVNKGGMIFKSAITPFVRMKGLFQPQVISESEISDGDDQSYSLYQDARLEYRLVLEGLNTQLQDTLNAAAGLDNFRVNGLHLIKKSQTVERYEAINLGRLEMIFALGGSHLGIGADEITLQPSTGLLNGGGEAAKPSDINDYVSDEKTRLILGGVTFLLVNGQSIAIENI